MYFPRHILVNHSVHLKVLMMMYIYPFVIKHVYPAWCDGINKSSSFLLTDRLHAVCDTYLLVMAFDYCLQSLNLLQPTWSLSSFILAEPQTFLFSKVWPLQRIINTDTSDLLFKHRLLTMVSLTIYIAQLVTLKCYSG